MQPEDSIEKALRDPDPLAALRLLAIHLSLEGYSRKEIYDVFYAKYLVLQEHLTAVDEHLLGDVMDMITNEYPPNNLNLPELSKSPRNI